VFHFTGYLSIGNGIGGDRLFKHSIEQQAPRARGTPVEAEGELIKIVVELFRFYRSLVCTIVVN